MKDRIIEGNQSKILPENVNPTGWDTRKSHEVFGTEWRYIDLETSVVDTVKDLIRLESVWQK